MSTSSEEASIPKHWVWCWWTPGEPEDGMLGFATAEDCANFRRDHPGPFRRVLSADGRTIPQTATWADFLNEVKRIIGENRD